MTASRPEYGISMSSVSSLSDGQEADVVIRPPSTGGDDGSPSESLLKDVNRILALIEDERHLVAHDLYCNVRTRVDRPPPSPVHSPTKKGVLLRRKEKRHLKEAMELKVKENRMARDLFTSKQAEFEKLETLTRLFRKAKEETEDADDWIFSQSSSDVDTFYRREEDGSLSIKLEGALNGVPLFEQVAVLRDVDLHYKWVPFCSSSIELKMLDKIDIVGWFATGLPSFGLMRDGCFRAIGCDSIYEDGKIILVGQGIADRKRDAEVVDSDDTYLADDPAVKELDIPPVPTRIGAGRMTIQKFEAVIEILSPTSAKTRLVANVNPNLDFIPQSLIDFLMRKLCGVVVNKLQIAAAKCAKDPIKNAHARRMRQEADFYEGWLKPKFQDFCNAQGWDMPLIAALELTEEEERKALKYQNLKSLRRAQTFNKSNRELSAENSASACSEPAFPTTDDVSELSTLSPVWQNNPIAGYLRELESRAQQRKANNIALARKRAADRLKKSKLTDEEEDRLKELKRVKARRLQQTSTTFVENGEDGRKVNLLGKWTKQLYHHHPYTRFLVTLILFGFMVTIFYATGVPGVLTRDSSHWWSGLLRDVGTVVYLGLCALAHFLLCDVAFVYAFESLELGMKTGRQTKQFYRENIHMVGAVISGAIVASSTMRALLVTWMRGVVWYALEIKHCTRATIESWAPVNATAAVEDTISSAASFLRLSGKTTAWLGNVILSVMGAAVTATRAVINLMNSLAIRSNWIGRTSENFLLWLFSFPYFVVVKWNDFVSSVVANREGTLELPSWRSDAIDSSRFLLLHSAVFLLTILFLFNVSTPKNKTPKETADNPFVARNVTAEEMSTSSNPASITENETHSTEMSSQSAWQRRQANRWRPSSPSSGGSDLQHEVIDETNEYGGANFNNTVMTPLDVPNQVGKSIDRSSPARRKKFRLKKIRFKTSKKAADERSEASAASSKLRKVASDGSHPDLYPDLPETNTF